MKEKLRAARNKDTLTKDYIRYIFCLKFLASTDSVVTFSLRCPK